MAILPVRLCRIFRRSFFFLFPFGKCPLALIAFIILLNHRQQTPCQRLIYKLWNLSGVNIIHIIAVLFLHSVPPFTAHRCVFMARVSKDMPLSVCVSCGA